MRAEVLILALIVGACTWGFRFFPLRADLSRLKPDGALSRFLAATGPAAIATLFVAEIMPSLRNALSDQGPLLCGVLAVFVIFAWRKSVVLATLAGSLAFGVATALLG